MRSRKSTIGAGLAFLVLAGGLHAETSLDILFNTALSGGEVFPSVVWAMTSNVSRIEDEGPSWLFDLDVDASKNLLDSGYSGSADLGFSAYRLFGRMNVGLRLEAVGVLPSTSVAGSAAAALSLPITLNGDAISVFLRPSVSIDPFETGYGSCGLESGFSFMAGAFVLKPGLDLALIHPWSGGLSYSLKPGMKIAWYPGFPLSLSCAGEYRADKDDVTDGWTDSWGMECIGVAAPTGWLLLTLTANANFESSAKSATVLLESAFVLSRDKAGKEWSLPLQLGYVGADGASSFSLGVGLRYVY